jgi:hypothetical protein
MIKVTVKDRYLNVRVGDPLLNAPSYQYIAPGSEIEVDGLLYPGDPFEGNSMWLKDAANNYYWSGGVSGLPSEDLPPDSLVGDGGAFGWWLKHLGIDTIWSVYKEKGEFAKVAVIDTGYNVSNSEIHEGVVGTYLHPSYIGKTTINDNDGHGSYCASIIGSRNKQNIVGSAPACHLYISKMSNSNGLNKSKLCDAIDDAIANKVDIISISSGGEPLDLMKSAIKKAVKNNIIVIAAIGNNESAQYSDGGDYPALYDECIAVGSSDKNDKISLVTVRNPKTEINAPGQDILGYILSSFPEQYETSTSAATALVSGICALMISYLKKNGRTYSPSSIRDLIIENCNLSKDDIPKRIISPTKIFTKLKTT